MKMEEFIMDWYIIAHCDACDEERVFEVESDHPPYELGDLIEECRCGGKFVVDEIREMEQKK
jgi:hypothetical protein